MFTPVRPLHACSPERCRWPRRKPINSAAHNGSLIQGEGLAAIRTASRPSRRTPTQSPTPAPTPPPPLAPIHLFTHSSPRRPDARAPSLTPAPLAAISKRRAWPQTCSRPDRIPSPIGPCVALFTTSLCAGDWHPPVSSLCVSRSSEPLCPRWLIGAVSRARLLRCLDSRSTDPQRRRDPTLRVCP